MYFCVRSFDIEKEKLDVESYSSNGEWLLRFPILKH